MAVPLGRRPTESPDVEVREPEREGDPAWLASFHGGDAAVMEDCYRRYFEVVERAIGQLLRGADRESAVHELFSRLIARPELRRSFAGGSLGAWLATIARHQAIDYGRRLGREVAEDTADAASRERAADWAEAAEARLLIDQFRRNHLPPGWDGVFEARFLQQLTQREAAVALGLSRTTVALRELRIRRRLLRFLDEETGGGDDDAKDEP